MKISDFFIRKNAIFFFWVVKFSVYLNRRVFVMTYFFITQEIIYNAQVEHTFFKKFYITVFTINSRTETLGHTCKPRSDVTGSLYCFFFHLSRTFYTHEHVVKWV